MEPVPSMVSDSLSFDVKAARKRSTHIVPVSHDVVLPTNRQHFRIPPDTLNVLDEFDSTAELATSFPVLEQELTSRNYLEKFHLLLHIEEYMSIISPKNLRAVNARLMAMDVPGHYGITLRGRNKGRFRCRDWVVLTSRGSYARSCRTRRFSGQVVSLLDDGMTVHLRHGFDCPNEYHLYDIYLQFGRRKFRQLHNAVHDGFNLLGERFLFPSHAFFSRQRKQVEETSRETSTPFFDTSLDQDQQDAVKNISRFRSGPYLLTGASGTGKSRVIIELLFQLTVHYSWTRVLVCSYNEASLLRLMERFLTRDTFDKFSQSSQCIVALMPPISENIPALFLPYVVSAEKITGSILSRIIFTTCGGAAVVRDDNMFHRSIFTHVIVDDAGMLTEPETLCAVSLFQSSEEGRVVLVGDTCQMPPEVGAEVARKYGLQNSLLFRVKYEKSPADAVCEENELQRATCLLRNYRSTYPIASLLSGLFYDGKVKCKSFNETSNVYKFLDSPVVFWPVNGEQCSEGAILSCYNDQEAKSAVCYLQKLYSAGVSAANIGIIIPFSLQVMRIRRLCGTKGIPVPRIGFVEDFINDEKAVILISCVESYPAWAKSSYDIPGFISSPEMSNTAVSRAREHLVVFGNPNTLGKDMFWKSFVEMCIKGGFYEMTPENMNVLPSWYQPR